MRSRLEGKEVIISLFLTEKSEFNVGTDTSKNLFYGIPCSNKNCCLRPPSEILLK